MITTQLYFMPDVEVTCAVCKGARFSADTLDVTLRGKTITGHPEHADRKRA
jgi:excinuclease ABC subunit A